MGLRKLILAAAFGIATCAGNGACAFDQQNAVAFQNSAAKSQGSLSDEEKAELARRQRDFALAPIKSQADLYKYMQTEPANSSPLNWLTPDARQRFIASLTFNETGLTGFSYVDLQTQLTATQIYKVLSLFGAQRLVPKIPYVRVETATDKALMAVPMDGTPGLGEDHEGYECIRPHTCGRNLEDICMSGC